MRDKLRYYLNIFRKLNINSNLFYKNTFYNKNILYKVIFFSNGNI